jgi:CRISPR-associated protein Cas2
MARRHYLFSYDISDDKRRTRVFKILDSWGDHAQYSVFFSELNPTELARLKTKLDGVINHDEDQVLVLDLGPEANPLEEGLVCLGRTYHPASRVMVV